MINEERPPIGMHPFLPPFRQGPQIIIRPSGPCGNRRRRPCVGHRAGAPCSGINPRGGAFVVIYEEHPTVGSQLHTPPRRQAFWQVCQVVCSTVIGERGIAPRWLVISGAVNWVFILGEGSNFIICSI